MVETMGICRGIIIPGFLRRCRILMKSGDGDAWVSDTKERMSCKPRKHGLESIQNQF